MERYHQESTRTGLGLMMLHLHLRPAIFATVVMLGAAGCSSILTTPVTRVSGIARLRAGQTPAAAAVFTVALETRTDANAAGEVIARVRQSPAGLPPYRFLLEYNGTAFKKSQSYFVRAQVELNGEILFRSKPRAVSLAGTSADVRLVLRKPPAEAPMLESFWRLAEVRGQVVSVDPRIGPRLVTHPERRRAVAVGGCNNMLATFDVDGRDLKFSPMPGTMLPCEQGAAEDDAFLVALRQSVRWDVSNGKLELLDGRGECTSRFASGLANQN